MNASPAERPRDWNAPRRRLELAAGLGAFIAAYYLAYRFSMQFSRDIPSPFWIPDSILLCALLRAGPKHWWLFIAASLPIRLFSVVAHDIPLWFLLGVFAIDSAKGLIAATALRRVLPNPVRLQTVGDCAWFGLIAVLLVPAASAFPGAALISRLGVDYWPIWQQWFLGDAVAQLVITPAILCWIFWRPWTGWRPGPWRILEAAAVAAGIAVTGYAAFNLRPSSLSFAGSQFYAPIPFLFWAAIRFGMAGASAAVLGIAFLAVHSALSGGGPFLGQRPEDVALGLQNFLLLRAVPLYLVAASTEQRRSAEHSLRESEARFRHMADAAPVFLWTSGPDKLCDFFNQGWLRFTGRSLAQERGNGWAEGVHPEDFEHCYNAYSSAFDARQPFEIQYRLRRHDGEYRWVSDVGVPRHDPAGQFLGYIGSAVDISERKQAEDGNRLLTHIQRLAVMGELTAAIAHEVRQPLSAIKINADTAERLLARADPPLAEIREILTDIRTDNQRADDVLNRIRNFLRKREPNMEALDVNAMVREVFHFISGEALRRRVIIHLELADTLPAAFGDQIQLQQVLLNLIVNGMDAMESLAPVQRRLTLRTRAGGGTIEIAVMDRGRGISAEHLPRLFDTFFTTRSEGMGLGLAIARSIALAHRGRIRAANNETGGGATFSLDIPVARSAAA